MFDTLQIQKDFSDAARQYDKNAALQQQVLSTLVMLSKPLPAEGLVLDAGCGTGQLARLLPEREVLQLDIAYAMCAHAGAHAINADIAALPFADNAFNVVFSSLALQWTPNVESAIRELSRVVKPGGTLAMSTFGDGTLYELEASFAAADGHAHVSQFAQPTQFMQRETIREYYPDLQSLMLHLKTIGARNKLSGRRKSLMTKRQLQLAEDYYRENFGTPRGLPVTWEVLYGVRRKK